MLVGGKKLFGVPIFAEQDGICKVTNGLGDDSPLKRTGLPTKTQPKHHQEDANLNELGACLDCRSRVEVTLFEGRLIINFGGQDGTLGKSQRAVTTQLTIRLMHAPNMQGMSSSVLTRLLTEVPGDHLKLWSWV